MRAARARHADTEVRTSRARTETSTGPSTAPDVHRDCLLSLKDPQSLFFFFFLCDFFRSSQVGYFLECIVSRETRFAVYSEFFFSPHPSLDIFTSLWKSVPCGYSRAANEKRTTRSRHMSDVPSGDARTPRPPTPECSRPASTSYTDRNLAVGQSGESRAQDRASRLALASLPLADPVRHAKRLPVRILQMLSARAAHMLHADYLQPLSSAPLPIEV